MAESKDVGTEYAERMHAALPSAIDAEAACIGLAILLSWVIRETVGVRARRAPTHEQLNDALGLSEDIFRDVRNLLAMGAEDASSEKQHGRA